MEISATIPASIPNADPGREKEIHPIVPTRSADRRGNMTGTEKVEQIDPKIAHHMPFPGEEEPAIELPTPREVRLQLHIDDNTGEVYGTFVDRKTGDEIRQLPNKEIRRLSAQIKEMLGNLVDKIA